WNWIVERAQGTDCSLQILERVGLLRRKDLGGGFYDWFRGRVMFPIRDARSRTIAFGGRVLPQLADDRSAKYINSPEMPLFSKSRELYALDVARERFKEPGGAIVMEGYTDVLMAHQHGIRNCVAVLGTALGERHVQLLHRNSADKITLVLDGDDAGRRRTNEILDALLALFEKKEVNLRILTLPEGIDPCDFIATHGSDQFRALIADAVDPLEHKFRAVTNGLDTLTDTHRASLAAEELLATLAQLRPTGGASSATLLREEQMLSRIARHFHLPEEKLRSRLASLRKAAAARHRTAQPAESKAQPRLAAPTLTIADLPACDRLLVELLLAHPNCYERITQSFDPNSIATEIVRRVYSAWMSLADNGRGPEPQTLIAEFNDPGVKSLLVGIDFELAEKPPVGLEQFLSDVIAAYERRAFDANRRAALAQARNNDAEADDLLIRFCEESRSKHLSEYERRKK
ncbi:MAG TPA: toprim domain-containing protein, partial [Lacipirellulaceae bacterium]|nr:toprim domain-containing protein [Lacipirellulaceae bacterium]